MEISNLKKIKKTAIILKKVLNVSMWILVSTGVLLLISEFIVSMMKETHFVLNEFYLGDITIAIKGWFDYQLVGDIGNTISLKPLILIILPVFIISIVFYIINIKHIQVILKSIIDDKPFDEGNARSLFIMSISFIVASVLFQVTGSIVAAKAFSLLGISTGNISLLPDFSMLFTGLFLMILSGVFKYGHYLQEEYNDTV